MLKRDTPQPVDAKEASDAAPPATVFPGLFTGAGGLVRWVPFYYGYAMVPVAMIALAATSPGQTFLISVFYDALSESLGLSASQLTGAYAIGSFLACLPMPFVGALQDRFGIRRTMFVVVIGFGMACIGASYATGVVTLCMAFFFLRMLGQGSLTMLAGNTLAMWFRARLGTVSGLQSLAMAVSIAVMPNAVLGLVEDIGWRRAFVTLGVVVLAVMIPLIAIAFRNRPEDIGQQIDGLRQPRNGESPAAQHVGPDLTLRQAVRTRAYWIMLCITAGWAMIGTAVFFNIQPILGNSGIEASTAAAMFITFGICLAAAQLVSGALSDRLPLNHLLAAGAGLFALAVILLIGVTTAATVHVYAALAGMGQGTIAVASNTAWARYYGRSHLGKIRGSLWTVIVAASSAGPFIVGFGYDQLHSYTPTLILFACILVPLSFAALWATAPKLQEQTRTA